MKTVSAALLPMITVDRKARCPLHRQVYDAYRAAIAEGMLRAAQQVPSTRVLATELGVSRIPVLHAYAQLVAEGYFQSRVGAGTHVAEARMHGMRPLRKFSRLHEPDEDAVWQRDGAFLVGQVAHDHFPARVWNTLVSRYARSSSPRSLNHGNPMGLWALREAIAGYLRTARAVRCEPDQVMIVNGTQEAIAISAQALLAPGQRVWMEEPGCQSARHIFALRGCHTVPVAVDAEGLNVAAGTRQCWHARGVLVTPSHQHVLGVTMSASRRLQLLDWAERARAWILEVEGDPEYRYEGGRVPSLQGLDPHSRVVYIGTFSKLIFPSLRLGYLVIPPEMLERFRSIRIPMDGGPPTFCQSAAADFIREGHFSRHLRRMRLLYGERRAQLVKSLREHLPSAMEVTGDQAGLHVALTLRGVKDVEIAERAARAKLWLSPLSLCYTGDARRQGFMLGFGNVAVEEIPRAVDRLRAIIAAD